VNFLQNRNSPIDAWFELPYCYQSFLVSNTAIGAYAMSEVHVAEHSNTGRAVKAMHWFATIGSPTERSGRITTAKSGLTIVGLVVGEVAFPSNRYVLDNSGAARVGVEFNYYKIIDDRFDATNQSVRARFPNPANVFRFTVD
jgi:hypothetical protein